MVTYKATGQWKVKWVLGLIPLLMLELKRIDEKNDVTYVWKLANRASMRSFTDQCFK